MFSMTVMRCGLIVIWKVRHRPARAIWFGARFWISRPSNMILPRVGFRNPLIRLTSVVLPEPLGPISPKMLPSATVSETSSSATRPPKRLWMCSTLSITVSIATAALRNQTLGHVQDHQNDDEPNEHHAQSGKLGRQIQKTGGVVDALDDDGAGQGAEVIARTAEDDHGPDQKGFQRQEIGRVDETDEVSEQGAAQPGDAASQRHG